MPTKIWIIRLEKRADKYKKIWKRIKKIKEDFPNTHIGVIIEEGEGRYKIKKSAPPKKNMGGADLKKLLPPLALWGCPKNPLGPSLRQIAHASRRVPRSFCGTEPRLNYSVVCSI